MHILGILILFLFWLLILWLGSIALEATGLERSKARFQALSALTGTGFTTSQAELIVEHPKRRQITTYLMLLGNTVIIAFIILEGAEKWRGRIEAGYRVAFKFRNLFCLSKTQ